MRIFTIIAFLFFSLSVWAQRPFTIQKKLEWSSSPVIHNPTGNFEKQLWSFKDSYANPKHPTLPVFSERFEVINNGTINVELVNAQFEPLNKLAVPDDVYLKETIQIGTTVEADRDKFYGKVFFIPIIKKGNRYEKLVDFDLNVTFNPVATNVVKSSNTDHAFNSVLKDGTIYKIAIREKGIQKLDYAFLKDELNIDIDNIDPTTIKIYGNGGGILPRTIADFRYDDLQENAIEIVGEEDGRFDDSDYILFYGEDANPWRYSETEAIFNQEINIYDNNNFYFIKISGGKGLRISNQNSLTNTTYTSNAFTDYARVEEELINLLDNFSQGQGTGKNWYGDLFETIRERTYNDFSFPNILTTEAANIKTVFAGRSNVTTSFNATVGSDQFSATIRRSNTGDVEDKYAHLGTINETFLPNAENLPVNIVYPQSASSTGWLDYIQLNVRRSLSFEGGQMSFRDPKTLDAAASTFEIANVDNNVRVWDISNPLIPKNQQFDLAGNTLNFGTNTATLREFVAFDANSNFFTPTAIGNIPNQNIHEIASADLVIVYHEAFENAVQQLATHRRNHSNYEVFTVLADDIYNEFSSGSQDPTAIRDFVRMVANRSSKFNYLLLFGDGSFDYKNLKNLPEPSGFIPVYETDESLEPIEGFPTDDYYALLSDNEGDDLRGAIDIAVGRIPVKTSEEAEAVVRKIINYDTNPQTLGNWRLNQAFMADDERTLSCC